MDELDAKLFAPATQRNREPILEVLSRVLPAKGTVLELASGSGEHAVWFAQHLRPLVWQPSDPDPAARRSIAAHAAGATVGTILPPLDIDVRRTPWPADLLGASEAPEAIICINMIHIAPWSATEGLMRGAAGALIPGGLLFLYGPFIQQDRPTAPSNIAFDQSLRARDPDWGIRDLEAVAAEAGSRGLTLEGTQEMPSNNLSLWFRKASS